MSSTAFRRAVSPTAPGRAVTRTAVVRAAALLVFALGLSLAPARAGEEPPRLLWSVNPMTPWQTAGSGEAPEVKARLAIDARGRVTAVEILSLQPSGTFDQHFRDAVTKALANWRFAPARQDGVAVPATQERTYRFTPQAANPVEAQLSYRGLASATIGDVREAELAVMPVAVRRRVGDDEIARAEALLDARTRQQAEVEYVTAVTDLPTPGTATKLAGNVIAAMMAAHEVLRAKAPDQPTFGRLHVYVFRTREKYLKFAPDDLQKTGGFYSPAGLLAFHAELPSVQNLLAVMLHEATHAYVGRHLVRPGVQIPTWLNEGFAEYIGNSDIEKGRLVAGSHKSRRTFQMTWGGLASVETSAAARADAARLTRRENKDFGLAVLLRSTRSEFYADAEGFYAKAYAAVHFLRHGRPGWDTGAFPTFMLYVAEGYAPDAAFRHAYGVDPASLEAEFARYEKKL